MTNADGQWERESPRPNLGNRAEGQRGVLRPSGKPRVDFLVETGSEFRLVVLPADFGTMRLKEATYGGVTQPGPQVVFRARAGRQILRITHTADRKGELGTLMEAAPAGSTIALRGIRSTTTSCIREYVIEGV